MTKLYFNPVSHAVLERLKGSLPQAVLLTGKPGIGLLTAAKYIAGDNLQGVIEPIDKDDAVNHLKGTVSVKKIRELYDDTKGKSVTQRVFILDDADKMSPGAQNAFLKLLEEPNQSTHFILTSHNPNALLVTVKSRVETVALQPITHAQSEDMASALKLRGDKTAQAMFIAVGRPAEIARLAADDDYFKETAGLMVAAKNFLSGNKASAVEIAFQHATSRELAMNFLIACKTLLQHTVKKQPSPELIAQLERVSDAYAAINANGNVKLHLMAIMV